MAEMLAEAPENGTPALQHQVPCDLGILTPHQPGIASLFRGRVGYVLPTETLPSSHAEPYWGTLTHVTAVILRNEVKYNPNPEEEALDLLLTPYAGNTYYAMGKPLPLLKGKDHALPSIKHPPQYLIYGRQLEAYPFEEPVELRRLRNYVFHPNEVHNYANDIVFGLPLEFKR